MYVDSGGSPEQVLAAINRVPNRVPNRAPNRVLNSASRDVISGVPPSNYSAALGVPCPVGAIKGWIRPPANAYFSFLAL